MTSITPNLQLALNYDLGAVWAAGMAVSKGEIAYPRRWNGFGYQAIQTANARTGNTEPTWPTVAGATVVDGGVTWQAHALGALTWTCKQLYVLGAAEAAWPTAIGATVANGTALLKCFTFAVRDTTCPHSKAILSAAGKLWAVDDDAVRYSATSNPLGWSTTVYPSDAGFLDTGSQMAGEPVPNALALFRGNMVVFGYSSIQVWQIDPDPARVAIVDTIEGIGTPYSRAHAAVGGDLLFTARTGVKAISTIAPNQGASTVDVGTPVDELVKADLAAAGVAGFTPIAVHHPGTGEFWLFINSTAHVLRQNKQTGFAAWSRYTLPGPVTYATPMDADLWFLVPSLGKVYKVDPAAYTDDGVQFQVSGETPYIELTPDGSDCMTLGVDCVAGGPFTLAVAYNEADPAGAVTAGYPMPAKSKDDGAIPVHLNGVAAASLRFTQQSATAWSLDELQLHFEPLGTT